MIASNVQNGFKPLMLMPVKILGLEELLGSENLWPLLLGVTVVPTVLQMSFLPFCPESPRFLYIVRCQEHQAKRGEGSRSCFTSSGDESSWQRAHMHAFVQVLRG